MIAINGKDNQWYETVSIWAGINTRLIILTALTCTIAAGVAFISGISWLVESAIGATALVAPMFLMEFARRVAILDERFYRLVRMAIAYSVTATITVLVWPHGHQSFLMPITAIALGAVGATSIFAFGKTGRPLLGNVTTSRAIGGHAQFSLWASFSHLGFSGYNFGVQTMLGAVAGPTALGIFHACRSLIQPINTLVGAMDSIDKPRAARAYLDQGKAGLFKALLSTMTFLLILGGGYIFVVVILDTWLLEVAYGAKYKGAENVVMWWCGVATLTLFSQPLESGLYVIRRTREMFYSRLAAGSLSLVCAYLTIEKLGAAGALFAMAVGYGISAVCGGMLVKRHA